MGKRGYQPFKRNAIEAAFEQHLRDEDKASTSIQRRMRAVHRFLKHVGDVPLNRVSEDVTRAFFYRFKNRNTRKHMADLIRPFLAFALPRLPVPVNDRGVEIALKPAVQSKKEIALRKRWSVERLVHEKEAADDLIAKLARKVSDHYLYFQTRLSGGNENLDEVGRLADECRDLIESNLPLFMALSAGGRNVHPKIDERMQR